MSSDKKKVLHLAHEMGVGGTQQVIRQLVGSLDTTRFECSVACIDGMIGMIGEELQHNGLEFHVFDRQPGFDRQLIRDIRQVLLSESIDIVHCHQYTPYTYGVLAALFTDVKVVFTEHGRFYPDSYSWKRRLINPLLQHRTDSIVAISAATADALAEYEWFTRRSIDVIYNGTDVEEPEGDSSAREELQIPAESLVFGTIARFDPIKNLPMMINGFREVHQRLPDTRLLMVGDGEEREALEALVKEAGLKDSVLFTGYQSDTARYMSAIDVYLLTSFSEGTSMTLLEAMATRKPPIVTAVGGNIEIVEHLKNGLVVDSGDTERLVSHMNELVEDKQQRVQLGNAARDEYEKRFSVSSMTEQYEAVYKRCLKIAA
ncbi:MAG: glycosyltransferase [Pseudomonadota bacterium]